MEGVRILGIAMAGLALALLLAPGAVSGADQPTIEQLKARVANASPADRPPLCLHIAERQLEEAKKLLAAGESDKAKEALADVVIYAGMDRDSSVQTHKHEKQSEIAIRKMVRKLEDMKHTVSRDEQDQLQQAIEELQRVRDDLLVAMFPKAGKK